MTASSVARGGSPEVDSADIGCFEPQRMLFLLVGSSTGRAANLSVAAGRLMWTC